MRNVFIGCLGLGLVLLLVGGGAFYYFLWRPLNSQIDSLQEIAAVSEMDSNVENQQAYTPPDDGVMTEAQVNQFLRVQERVRGRLGERLAKLEDKYDRLDDQLKREGRDATMMEVLGAWRDVSGLLADAKRAQVDALNAQDLSLHEYRWIRQQAYMAVGVPTLDLAAMAEAAQQGDFDAARLQPLDADSLQQRVPPENRDLVEPHLDMLEETAALALFGL
jgi:HAMP domain-containing protein